MCINLLFTKTATNFQELKKVKNKTTLHSFEALRKVSVVNQKRKFDFLKHYL